jgi:hypothetical protein
MMRVEFNQSSISLFSTEGIRDHLCYLSRKNTAICQKKFPVTLLVFTGDAVTGTKKSSLATVLNFLKRWPQSDSPVQYLNNRSNGQNLRSTSGQAEPVAVFL